MPANEETSGMSCLGSLNTTPVEKRGCVNRWEPISIRLSVMRKIGPIKFTTELQLDRCVVQAIRTELLPSRRRP